MIPRISSIENLIASDPGGRNIFGLVIADQLRLAAQSLRLARRVGIVSGFFIPAAGAGETDGPSGAKVVGQALESLGIEVDYLTDRPHLEIYRAIGLSPLVDHENYLEKASPTHLLSIERAGRNQEGLYRNINGEDIGAHTAPLDSLFLEGAHRGLTTIGIGDGGNEIGMGKVFADTLASLENGKDIATVVQTDFCIAAGVSNWGAYGLTGALSVLARKDLLPPASEVAEDIRRMVRDGGAVDGITHRAEPTVDGLDLSHTVRMLEEIRHQTRPSPIESGKALKIGILGYGISGRAAADLLAKSHSVRVSDSGPVMLTTPTKLDGIESGGHSIEFLQDCDLVVASPGVNPEAPIRNELHERGIPIVSELEIAYQHCPRKLIAVTGTVGKRTTVELMQHLFEGAGTSLTIGGNRGDPLSALVRDRGDVSPIAVAVSSFQLETIVNFRPDIAIILNLNEAHLDRHRSLAEYERIKSRIFMNQRPNDALIVPFDNARIRHLARKRQGRTFFVSEKQPVDRGAWLIDDRVSINVDGANVDLGSATAEFPENLLAAVMAAVLMGISVERIRQALGAAHE
ncbi:MAG: glutamate cyclase domain-containing protein [Planctomycetota bacterium]|jgi:hypothetical protein